MEEFNVLSIMEQIPTEAAAYEFMENLRWGGTPECPHSVPADTAGTTGVNRSRRASSGSMSILIGSLR